MNSKKRLRKGLVTYYKTSGITYLQKHLDVAHSTIYKRFQKELIIKGKKMLRNNLHRKGFIFPIFPYLNFLFQKMMWSKICLWNLALLITKNHLPLKFVENLVKMFNVTIISSCAIPFSKIIFKHCFA
jgi:hypothetical protein